MEGFSGYQRQGMWVLIVGIIMAGSVLLHMEMGRAKPSVSVEYIGKDPTLGTLGAEIKGEPASRAPASFPASQLK